MLETQDTSQISPLKGSSSRHPRGQLHLKDTGMNINFPSVITITKVDSNQKSGITFKSNWGGIPILLSMTIFFLM